MDGNITGQKRRRDEEDEINEDNETSGPPKKKIRIPAINMGFHEEIFSFLSHFFPNSSIQICMIRKIPNKSTTQKFNEILDVVKADKKSNADIKKLIFLLEYFLHEVTLIQLGSIFNEAKRNNFEEVNAFFRNKIKTHTRDFFESRLLDGNNPRINEKKLKETLDKAIVFRVGIDEVVTDISDLNSQPKPSTKKKKKSSKNTKTQEMNFYDPKNSPIFKNTSILNNEPEDDNNNSLFQNLPDTPLQSQPRSNFNFTERVKAGDKRISISFLDSDGVEINFGVRRKTRFKKVIDTYLEKTKKKKCSIKFVYESSNLDDDDRFATVGSIGFKDGDIIDVLPEQTGGKPVILLYPPHDNFKVSSVQVKLSERWEFHSYYPKPSENQSNLIEWKNMMVNKNGDIKFEKSDGLMIKNYENLFWSSKSSNSRNFDFSEIEPVFLVKKENIDDFIIKCLLRMGLKENEINDFYTFWIETLNNFDLLMFQFMGKKEYEDLVQLNIVPKPDQVSKIFMKFLGISSKDEIKEERRKFVVLDNKKFLEENSKKFSVRLDFSKFVVMEWGGMDLKESGWVEKTE